MNNYEIQQMLEDCATVYGDIFYKIAYLAICNSTDILNCNKPNGLNSIALPWGITRWNPKTGTVEYCCRAQFKTGFHAPCQGAAARLTDEFNAAANALGVPQKFVVYFERYPNDPNQIIIIAHP